MKILIADDDPVSNRLLSATLSQWHHNVVVTHGGGEAWSALHQKDAPRVAILDWIMPGMNGVDICRQLRQEKTDAPVYIILLTALKGKENLIEGLDAGADDYLTKPFDRNELKVRLKTAARIVSLQKSLGERVQELEEAIVERKRAEEALKNMSITDHLTGLYNHRGFFTLAEHHGRMARRTKQPALLLYADMDGLKQINDTLGHSEGSIAIARTADVLRQSFRDCDMIARVGGDEFVLLAPNVTSAEAHVLVTRLRQNLDEYNSRGLHKFKLALSIGAVMIDYNNGTKIEDEIARADRAMYEEKRARKVVLDPSAVVATPAPQWG